MQGMEPLQGMDLQEKDAQREAQKSVQKEPTVKRCLLILATTDQMTDHTQNREQYHQHGKQYYR